MRDIIRTMLLADQTVYHENRCDRSCMVSKNLKNVGEHLLLLTLGLLLMKILLPTSLARPGLIVSLGIATAVLLAMPASLVGVRSYAEFELLARQSEQMLRVLAEADAQLETFDLRAASAS